MKAWHCSENAYPYLPPADEYESIRVSLPNRLYDPSKGAITLDGTDIREVPLAWLRDQFALVPQEPVFTRW